MTAKRLSLIEYGAQQKSPGAACWMCGIPERQEVEDAIFARTVTKAAATRWLRDVCGYELATPNRVDNHMYNHAKRPA